MTMPLIGGHILKLLCQGLPSQTVRNKSYMDSNGNSSKVKGINLIIISKVI